ncbi:hypothetical protein Pelo_7103 [Pelomyxa schiedti]|nr:hypothetical protein Pelo_7103 [Pelomyxa schiedti]
MSASAAVATRTSSSSGEGRGATREAPATAVAAGTGTGTQGNHLGEQVSGQGVRAALDWVTALGVRKGEGVGEREAPPAAVAPCGGRGGPGQRLGVGGDYAATWGSCLRVCLACYVARDLLACFKPRNAQVTVDEERMASILDGMGTKLRAINFGVESDTGRSGLLLFKAIRRSSVGAVGLLLKHGANPYIKTKGGKSAISLAQTKQIQELIENASKSCIKPMDPPWICITSQPYGRGTDDWSGSPCFLGDGRVTCALTGVSLSVSDVRPGMKLRGPPRNTLSAKTTISQIRRIERTPVEKVMQIAFVNSLGLTPEHRIMIPKKGNNDNKEEPDWVKAGDVGELSSVFVKELFNFELEKDEENEPASVLINDLQVST